MAKAKKKKYTPRPVYIPQMVVATYSLDPLFDALNAILDGGEVEIDDLGVYSYVDTLGKRKTIESSLLLYTTYLDIYAIRNQVGIDTRPLERLRRTVKDKSDEMTEKEIVEAKACLAIAKKLLSTVPPSEHHSIIKTIYRDYEMRKGEGVLPVTGELLATQ